ncbi:uncharacterized protein LOC110055526 isoform X2 [Orbicella faveolata]|uniref:uncharacterized protein LOC110055526 isoform X2 n=1 Tax=Orbicella faveolata TaxID=48498 RepID=UPI0009E272A9|nr:uncharacterized protein LOC110055526 isoform X2 [Orbicella faveolata]
MCLRSQGRIRIREVLLGVLIGLGVAGVLVMWTNESVYMKHKPVMRYSTDDFQEHTAVNTRPVGNQVNADKPGTQENKHDDFNTQINPYKAYGHVKIILFFIGYPRSRHSLLGSLLDAHPHMVIADETNAFGKWSSNPNKWMNHSVYAYYDTIFNASQRAIKRGRRSGVFKESVVNTTSKYRYYVPNQWQSTFDQYIEIIGDKAGGYTAFAMKRTNAVEAVHLLEKTAGAKVKFVHVVRNPFDNIATMVLRKRDIKERYGEHKLKVNAPEELDTKIKTYFSMAEGCNLARETFPGSVIDVPSIEIVKNPVETLRRICQFLEIACTEQYLLDCAATVDPVPSITRDFIEWTAEQKHKVYDMMGKYSFFEGYSFDK